MEKDWPRYHQMGSFWQVNSDHSTSPAAYPTMGVPRARVRRLESQSGPPLEPALVFRRERLEAWSGT
jgi:hypothetical protein